MRESLKERRPFVVLCAFLGLVSLVWLASRSPSSRSVTSFVQRRRPCNPYEAPGYLNWDGDGAVQQLDAVHHASWVSYKSKCPAHDWLATLHQAVAPQGSSADERTQKDALKAMSWLQHKTILLIGDSVDRNALWQLAYFLGRGWVPSLYADAKADASQGEGQLQAKAGGWDQRGLPHQVLFPELGNALFTNGFHYGSNGSDFVAAGDYHAPSELEERLEQLILPYTRQLEHPVQFIQLHSGLWDLAMFGRQSLRESVSTTRPIPDERMDKYMERLKQMIGAVRRAYPGVPLYFRMVHRVGPSFASSGDFSSNMQGVQWPSATHFFSDLRVHQIRQAQRVVCAEMGVPLLDFGAMFEGWQAQQDKVHPEPLPGGFAYWWPLLHAIWAESQ